MDNETLFYICGIVLAVSALVVSFAGLKTSVRYFLRDHPSLLADPQKIRDLCASVQAAIVEVLRAFSWAAPCQIRAARARHLSRAASVAVFSSNVSWRGGRNLRSSPIPVGSSSMMGFPVHGLNGQ